MVQVRIRNFGRDRMVHIPPRHFEKLCRLIATARKKNSKDLTEFKVDNKDDNKGFVCESYLSGFLGYVCLEIRPNNHAHFTRDQIIEIHQKLGQVIAFDEREQNK